MAQRDASICVHWRERAANPNVVFLEMIDHGTEGALRVEHYKICPGRDHLQLAQLCLALEFVAVKTVAHYGRLMFIVMLKGRETGTQGQDIGAVLKLMCRHGLGVLGRRN